jgi:hypothetical protein
MERHGGARDNTTQLSPRPDRPAAKTGGAAAGAAGAPAAPDDGTADSTRATQTGPTQRCTYPWY